MRYWHLVRGIEDGVLYKGQEVVQGSMTIAPTSGLSARAAFAPLEGAAPVLILNDTAISLEGNPLHLGTTTEPANVIVSNAEIASWPTFHLAPISEPGALGQLLRSVDPDDSNRPHPDGSPADPAMRAHGG
ncbi:hypothetical protein GCM10022219_11600 [Microbacterium oryzae]|uniref:Uncharacterized protein n=1 Tax=Microbacterium oryzae TaxID=743009 RepID=A0A6I6E7S4_9MICO|nr:hypothetical protein [Microbacterium oryzae]QGU28470.1 hypothetical protein D7D94_12910 [Microbacterium oryzae]